jgi:hypothetical protein
MEKKNQQPALWTHLNYSIILPGVTNKVGGDHIIFGVTEDSFQVALRLLPTETEILTIIKLGMHKSCKTIIQIKYKHKRWHGALFPYLIAALIWS